MSAHHHPLHDGFVVTWRTPIPLGHDASTLYADPEASAAILSAPKGIAESLATALSNGATEDALLDIAGDAGPSVAARWLQVFSALCRVGRTLPLLRTPSGDIEVINGRPVAGRGAPTDALRLSRFAVITPGADGDLLVEEPVADVRARVTPTLLAELVAPVKQTDASAPLDALPAVGEAARLGWEYGLLVAEGDPQESWWEPHDRYFHWRSRRGSNGLVSGATFPFDGPRRPLPVSPSLTGGAVVALPAEPSGDPLLAPATAVVPQLGPLLMRRTSTRDCAEPLTIADLAAFLAFHRVLEVVHPDATGGTIYPQSRRPYPGGGATYELELIVTAVDVAGLARGIWWYDAVGHSLVLLTDEPTAVTQVVDDALVSSGGLGTPRAIITYALRMGRNSWKYEGMAYRLALLDAGVLYHHAYLAGADLGVGVCGLGNGDSGLFSHLLDQDPDDLASVAEIMLTGRVADAR